VIGNPAGATNSMANDIWLHLDEPAGAIVDDVALGTSLGGDAKTTNNAPSGASSGVGDEAVARSAASDDTNVDKDDFTHQAASIGVANP
jgi:hypothetical protein